MIINIDLRHIRAVVLSGGSVRFHCCEAAQHLWGNNPRISSSIDVVAIEVGNTGIIAYNPRRLGPLQCIPTWAKLLAQSKPARRLGHLSSPYKQPYFVITLVALPTYMCNLLHTLKPAYLLVLPNTSWLSKCGTTSSMPHLLPMLYI